MVNQSQLKIGRIYKSYPNIGNYKRNHILFKYNNDHSKIKYVNLDGFAAIGSCCGIGTSNCPYTFIEADHEMYEEFCKFFPEEKEKIPEMFKIY